MQSKNLPRRALPIVVLLGCAVFLITFFSSPKNSTVGSTGPLATSSAASDEQEKVHFGLPVRLKIPAINVDAAVTSVGLASDGAMDVPKGPSDVAWFNLGQRPGEEGSAVIAGHYGIWKNGQLSVFNNVNKLHTGDKLYIEDDKGTTVSFVVRESRSYNPNADATDVFGSNDGKSHLNLITCEGTWSESSKSYPQRLVVFADKE